MALENAPVSIKALMGKEKLRATEKSEVRGFVLKTLIEEEKEGILKDKEGWVLCGLPSFFD